MTNHPNRSKQQQANHTPGPWQPVALAARWAVTTTAKPRTFNICIVNNDRIEQEANARLIAAAPELLAALKDARGELYIRHISGDESQALGAAIDKCDAAIAKAEGR